MRNLTFIASMLLAIVAFACSKKSSDPAPLTTDQGHGSFTYKGATFYLTNYTLIPSVSGYVVSESAVVNDTSIYDLTFTLAPKPAANASSPISLLNGSSVTLSIGSSKHKGASEFHYFDKAGETLRYDSTGGKRSFSCTNLTETDAAGNAFNGGSSLTATLKQ